MGAIGRRSGRRAAWLLASTSLLGLVFSSRAALSANCTIDIPGPEPDTYVFAGPGDINCVPQGPTYVTTTSGLIAGQASGGGVIIGTNVPISFTTSAAGTPAVEADTGGSVTLNGALITTIGTSAPAVLSLGGGTSVTLSGGTVLTFHDGSIGLEVSGSSASLTTTGTGIGVKTHGVDAFGAYNGPGPGFSTGGAMNLTNTNIVTFGQDAHAVDVSGAGSITTLGAGNALTTQGDGAIGIYAANGGVVSATTGLTTISTSGQGAFGADADGQGSQIKLGSATITTSGAGASGLFASDSAMSGSAGSITASGTLNITTTNAAAAAVALQGDGASISATGGGSIASAGDSIEFLGGTNQTASFDNFTIANQTGDLIFSDPSVATVNFNNTTANAGDNDLLDAIDGSFVTLNANASTLTGAIQTDGASTTTVNLTNGSTWTMTRLVGRLESRRRQQRGRLRPAWRRRRFQDADRRQLRRLGRQRDHERGAGRTRDRV